MTRTDTNGADTAGADTVDIDTGSVLGLLAAHVPLTLLIDMLLGAAVDSDDLYGHEPADCSWLSPAR